ncbi:hypothetical protein SCUCBS95973_007145 [Sporothrix curviconia]|uniref:Uncharacterized protein n=1 Tax=Sporothrix curviconia TaxID=1260050 RepID=A0ABP0CAZ0_9PEZI
MATDMPATPPAPSFPVTAPTLESDDYVVYHGRDTLAVFSARADGVQLNEMLNFSASTLLIYAETIHLQSKLLQLPGKNIGLFCHQLVLSHDEACIDVSGSNGADNTTPETKAESGGNGGSVWLYVEQPTPGLRKKLRIRAYGGDGGRGGYGVVEKPDGGDGGDGGACGTIHCYMGSTALRYGQRLAGVTSRLAWAGWVMETNKGLEADVEALITSGVDETAAKAWRTAVSNAASFLAATRILQTAVASLLGGNKPGRSTAIPGTETANTARALLDTVATLTINASGTCPIGVATATEAAQEQFSGDVRSLTSLAKLCGAFTRGEGGMERLQLGLAAVVCRLKEMSVPSTTAAGAATLEDILGDLLDALRNTAGREPATFTDEVCHLAGGRGGPGGNGRTAQDKAGARGKDMPSKRARTQLVTLSGMGSRADCQVDQAIACPEQCQMLLEQADRLYFTNDVVQYPRAVEIYIQLTQRLGFMDLLIKDAALRKTAPLALALDGLASSYGVTTDTLSQLDRIYATAQQRLNGIRLDQDVWGRSDVWVPRLSLAYYGTRVATMIANFKDLEATFKEYSQAHHRERITDTQLEQAQLANAAMQRAAKAQLDSIAKAGGDLEQAADAIELCRPRLIAARTALGLALEHLTEAVHTQFSVSTDTIVAALSTLVSSPTATTLLTQTADIVYKAGTRIEDVDGNAVPKTYVISQIATCSASLSSLAATFASLKAGDLTVDDPGYAKIFATADDINKILDDFADRVPSAADATRTQLDAFLAVVTKRNAAVLRYNGLLVSYDRLKGVLRHCAAEAQRLGNHALSLSPALPAVYFWLKTLKRDNLLQITQELNNQARALSFWGPIPVKDVTFAPPGPLDGSLQLRMHQETLVSLFEKSYEGFQSGGWHAWPKDVKNFTGEGIRVPLGAAALASLIDHHEAVLAVTPRSHTDFLDMANVRVTQVRVWLLGATVAAREAVDTTSPPRSPLRIEITHCGDDTVWTPDGQPCVFRHAPVTLQFSYETALFNSSKGAISGRRELVNSRQDIEHDYAGGPSTPGAADKPPIGPFGDWKINVRADVNPGLNLGGVTAGWIEFCGRNKAATSPLRGI